MPRRVLGSDNLITSHPSHGAIFQFDLIIAPLASDVSKVRTINSLSLHDHAGASAPSPSRGIFLGGWAAFIAKQNSS